MKGFGRIYVAYAPWTAGLGALGGSVLMLREEGYPRKDRSLFYNTVAYLCCTVAGGMVGAAVGATFPFTTVYVVHAYMNSRDPFPKGNSRD
jgi:hypothetical protein